MSLVTARELEKPPFRLSVMKLKQMPDYLKAARPTPVNLRLRGLMVRNERLTLLPRSLKMISTSRIGPNCCGEARKNNKTLIMPSGANKSAKAGDAYSEHRPQVGISKSKRYVGHVKTLWLRFGISWCGRGCRGAGGWNAARRRR